MALLDTAFRAETLGHGSVEGAFHRHLRNRLLRWSTEFLTATSIAARDRRDADQRLESTGTGEREQALGG